MKTYKAIIVEDELNSVRLLQSSIKELYPNIQIEAICTDWNSALVALRDHAFDILFMDVSMPGKTALELLKLAPQPSGQIIFITAYQQFAMEALNLQATGYILKPFNDEELCIAVNRAIGNIEKFERLIQSSAPGVIGISTTTGIDYILIVDIIYLEADNKCTKIVMQDRILYSSYTVAKFKAALQKHNFFQTHRSFLINLSAIRRYVASESTVVMKNGSQIPLSQVTKDAFLKLFIVVNRGL